MHSLRPRLALQSECGLKTSRRRSVIDMRIYDLAAAARVLCRLSTGASTVAAAAAAAAAASSSAVAAPAVSVLLRRAAVAAASPHAATQQLASRHHRYACSAAARGAATTAAADDGAGPSSGRSSSSDGDGGATSASTTSTSTSNSSSSGGGAKPQYQHGRARKQRLDDYCLALNPGHSKNLIQSWIVQGKVLINDRVVTKAGTPVPKGASVRINATQPKYVCRAGHKLEAALDAFAVDPSGLTALDAGLSTGGFTDCLLQRDVARVFGVDVGYGQVAGSIAQDERVTVMERTNLRHLTPRDLPCQVDLATLDLSFISVLKVLPAVARVLKPGSGQLIILIKPQFEAGREFVSAGGVVRDPKVHADVIARVTEGAAALGFNRTGVIESPLKGDKGGNTEFLAHYRYEPDAAALAAAEAAAAAAAGTGGALLGFVPE